MKRIQRRGFRDWSWRKNKNAVYVGRPTKWGNPFKMNNELERERVLIGYTTYLIEKITNNPDFLEPLRGKDLVCYCHLDKSCHADVIINYLERGIFSWERNQEKK